MVQTVRLYLEGCKMDIEKLKKQILEDASKEDLLPTSLMSKYDITLNSLMKALRDLLDNGFLTLTDKKWIRISEIGKRTTETKEDNKKYEDEGPGYYKGFFSRSNTVEVNEPYLPTIKGLKKLLEGRGLKETSNKKCSRFIT